MNIVTNSLGRNSVPMQELEIVERKGLGHPDTICDTIMNEVSVALSKAYVEKFGVVLHHNVDKALLAAGVSEPEFGGGKILEPMRLIFGDRATYRILDEEIDVEDIVIDTAESWFEKNIRNICVYDIDYQIEIKQGSGNLQDIFDRKSGDYLGANDTSATVGFAPFSPLENVVKDLEVYLNSSDFKDDFPCSGEDVKIMGMRRGTDVDLTVAMAFVDKFVEDVSSYFDLKKEILSEAEQYCFDVVDNVFLYDIHLNSLDIPYRGKDGCYLTVTGTSAESGDSGQVGRGNNPVGIISLNRPMSSEAAAGKNPVSHVGKIYNVLSYHIANRIYNEINGLEEVYVWLLSRIGTPINEPLAVSVQYIENGDFHMKSAYSDVENIIVGEFDQLDVFCKRLYDDVINLC
jgi:S-adenosylmethionine synthetase